MMNNIEPSNISRVLPDSKQPAEQKHVSSVHTGAEEETEKPYVYDKSGVKKQLEDAAADHLRYLVEELIQNQGKLRNRSAISIQDINQAKELISEDGPFGVQAVSDRIVDFAIAVSGNDTAKLGELKAAIDKGFENARDAFGGTLPDICNKTYDEVMRKLDEWAGTKESI